MSELTHEKLLESLAYDDETGIFTMFDGKNRVLGMCNTPKAAHKIYAAHAKMVHGEFARP